MRRAADVAQIARMLEAGDVAGAVRAVGLDLVQWRVWDRTYTGAFEAGGNAAARIVPVTRTAQGFRMVVQFDVRNPVAENYLREQSSRYVVELVEDQVKMVREHLVAGMAAGNNPRTVALDLVGRVGPSGAREGGVIGLTSNQAEWVRAYAAELASDNPTDALRRALRDRRFDAAVRRAAKTGEPIPADLRAKMVMSYKNRALKLRADSIARTEAMGALHAAQNEAMRQAIESGAIKEEAVTYIWRATKDDRTRDSHITMDGQEVAEGEYFVTGDGNRLRYPGDPEGPPEEIINCRCWREPKVDFLAGVT
jgi:hypothetical protein